MSMKIVSRKKNDLLNREECRVLVEHHGEPTPKRAEILKDIANEIKKPEDCIIIDKVITEFGKPESYLDVKVYDKKEHIPKEKLEKMKVRVEGLKKEAKAAAPQKPTAAAAPAAEKAEK